MSKRLLSITIMSAVALLWVSTAFSADQLAIIKQDTPVAVKTNVQLHPPQTAPVQLLATPVVPQAAPAHLKEIAMVPLLPTCEVQLAAQTEKADAKVADLAKELEKQKKAMLDATVLNGEKDQAVAALRAQTAESMLKLVKLQASVENEVFRLFIEKASSVKLRGFGPVQLVPLLNDYLVIISPDLAKNVDSFFSKIRKVVVVGKGGTYLICDRKYFVAAAPPELKDDTVIPVPSLGGAR